MTPEQFSIQSRLNYPESVQAKRFPVALNASVSRFHPEARDDASLGCKVAFCLGGGGGEVEGTAGMQKESKLFLPGVNDFVVVKRPSLVYSGQGYCRIFLYFSFPLLFSLYISALRVIRALFFG